MSSEARRGLLFVVSAPSGTGKTTVVERLVQVVPDLALSRSYTSRPMRAGESDGVEEQYPVFRGGLQVAESFHSRLVVLAMKGAEVVREIGEARRTDDDPEVRRGGQAGRELGDKIDLERLR